MDYKSAARDIAKGKHMPVYLCFGTEKFLLHEFITHLVGKLVVPEERDFALSRYDLMETNLDVVLEDAQTLPFMTQHKVVIADNALFFTGAKDTGKIDHPLDKLLRYIQAPVDFSVLVFTVQAEKLDERKKIVKLLKERGAVVSFLPMSSEELTQWVNRQAERLHLTFAEGAADQLVLYTGGQLQVLSVEIEKLSLYVGEGGQVDADIVAKLVVPSAEQNVFMLIDNIVHVRLDRALDQFHELLKQKEEPIKILMLIARQFRMILQVQALAQQGYSHQQIAGQIGQHPYAVKLAAEQSRRFEARQLEVILSQLGDLDYQMKSGKVDKVLGLEMFLLGLARNEPNKAI